MCCVCLCVCVCACVVATVLSADAETAELRLLFSEFDTAGAPHTRRHGDTCYSVEGDTCDARYAEHIRASLPWARSEVRCGCLSAAGIGGLSASGCAELMRTLNPGKPCPRATAPTLQAKGLYMRARVCFYVVCACACAYACVCFGGGTRPSLIATSPNVAEKYNKAPKKATVRWPHVWPTIVLSLPYRASQLALVTRQTCLSDPPPPPARSRPSPGGGEETV